MRLIVAMVPILLASCGQVETHPLFRAARMGDTSEIARLISQGADPNMQGGVNGWTVLLHAIHKNQPRSVIALLDHGADANGRGTAGDTALIMAAGYGHTSLVELLLARGADPRLETASGHSALAAALSGAVDIDRFTLGECQAGTLRALLKHTPGLRLRATVRNRIARFAACKEAVDLLAAPQA